MTQPIYFDAMTGKRIEALPASTWMLDQGPAPSYLVGPAFFDPQVNGYAGVDFQNPDITREQLEHSVHEIHRAGCAHFLLTLVTASMDSLRDQMLHLTSLVEQSALIRESVLGFHLEGPFISSKLGFRGAHPEEHTCRPSWTSFTRLQEASGGRIRVITLAPELEGSQEFIQKAVQANLLVSLGHTDASLEELRAAVRAGARLFTHLGNGCPSEINRHDNIIQRVLAVPDLMASVICDGIHLPPFVLGNLVRALGADRLVLITDAMSAAGAPPGKYRLGKLELEVGEDRVVRMPGAKNFAGSSLRMVDGFLNVLRFGALDVQGAWRAWTRLREILFPAVRPPWLAIPFPAGPPDKAGGTTQP